MKILKLAQLIKSDLFFLARYGLFIVYAVFIAVYLIILHYLPAEIGTFVMKLLIFSDPAAMGLFFMGAVVLLEKSQRVNCSLAVSPITTGEYIISKSAAFLIAGIVVALIIAFGSGRGVSVWGLIGVSGASVLFSMGGLFVASKTRSLNQFIICSLPIEFFISVGFLTAFGKLKFCLWIIHPGVAAMQLLFSENEIVISFASILSLVIWNVVVFFLTKRAVNKMFSSLGEGNL